MNDPTDSGIAANSKPAVSVIVPVFNTLPYLARCLDSLIRQTLRNIEILLIDDGSTDASGRLCDEYAARDARVRVVHQANAGLSEARNAGIDLAGADYLMFVDSDDWVEPDFCETPLTAALAQQADLVMFQYRKFRCGREEPRRCIPAKEGPLTQAEAVRLMTDGAGFTAWNKLYHRRLFLKNRYPAGKVYEDVFLTPVLVHEARRIVYSSSVLYNYDRHKTGITTELSKEHAQDWFDATELTAQRLRDWGFPEESERFYQTRMLGFSSKGWKNRTLNKKSIRYLRSLRHCPAHFSPKLRRRYYLCILWPGFYRLICGCFRRLL